MMLAEEAFRNVKDMGGAPYIFFVSELAGSLKSEAEKLTALLMDLPTKTYISLQKLSDMGFPERVLSAVTLLAPADREVSDTYLQAIRENPLALRVKLAALEMQCDLSREKEITAASIEQLRGYRRQQAVLMGRKAEEALPQETEPGYFKTREQVYLKVREGNKVSYLDKIGRWRPVEDGAVLFAASLNDRYRLSKAQAEAIAESRAAK